MEKILIEKPWIIILVLAWTLPWKGVALWRAARRGHLGWFWTLVILNTLAILDILYIFIFSNLSKQKKKKEEDKISANEEAMSVQKRISADPINRITIV